MSITNALSGFILRDWVVTAYLLTYTGASYTKFGQRGIPSLMADASLRLPHPLRKIQRRLGSKNNVSRRNYHLHNLLDPLRDLYQHRRAVSLPPPRGDISRF